MLPLDFGAGSLLLNRGPFPPPLHYSFDAKMPVPPRMPLNLGALILDEMVARLQVVESPLIEFGAAQICSSGQDDEFTMISMLTLQLLRTLRAESDDEHSLFVAQRTFANTALLIFGCSDTVWKPHEAWPIPKSRLWKRSLDLFWDAKHFGKVVSFYA